MALCANLDNAASLAPDCNALRKEGGAKKEFYVGSVADIGTYTQGANGELTALTMASGKKLIKLSGRKEKNNADDASEQTENGPLFTHNANFLAYISTQVEQATLETLAAVDDLFVIVPTSANEVKAYGLFGKNGIADGMSMTHSGGTGTAKGDSTAYTLAFTGQTSRMPVYVQLGADYDATIAALETKLVAAV